MSLLNAYDAFLLDLDGVLYRGEQPIPAAAATVEAIRGAGKRVVFLTNNSARTPEQVADKLNRLGISAAPAEVLTSAQATGTLLAAESGGGARTAFVIGQDGIRSALAEAGIDVVDGDPSEADVVVVGWDNEVTYDSLRKAAVLVRGGARLIATNADASYPAPGGELWPGAGAILAAVETASGESATVVGKPYLPLFEAALERAGTRNALMVGDRVETDIAGAQAAGLDSALVLSGAGTPEELVTNGTLPVAILKDIGGLLSAERVDKPRPAREDEIPDVRKLIEAPELAPVWGPEGVWVIGEPIEATATVEVRNEVAYVRGVATEARLRGSGWGTLVVTAALHFAASSDAKEAWLLTETAEQFFRGLGFERVARDRMPDWIEAGPADGCPQTAVAMRRGLSQ